MADSRVSHEEDPTVRLESQAHPVHCQIQTEGHADKLCLPNGMHADTGIHALIHRDRLFIRLQIIHRYQVIYSTANFLITIFYMF